MEGNYLSISYTFLLSNARNSKQMSHHRPAKSQFLTSSKVISDVRGLDILQSRSDSSTFNVHFLRGDFELAEVFFSW